MSNNSYPIYEVHGRKDDPISWSPTYTTTRKQRHNAISIVAIITGSAIACAIWTAISWFVNLF